MSLLMEALKKAEEAKRLAGDSLTPATPPNSPLPDLALHLDAIDSELTLASRRPSEPNSRAVQTEQEVVDTDRERRAVHNLFTTKQTDNGNRRLLPLLALALLIAFAAGGYFWWQLRSIPTQGLVPPPAAKMGVPQAGNPPVSSIGNDSVTAPGQNDAPAITTAPATPSRVFAARTRATAPESARAPAPALAPVPPEKEKRTEAAPAIRLSRTPQRVDPQLERAYAALTAGGIDEAQAGYEQVLRTDAKNTDALLGLATIAARRGLRERAYALYTLALESDPTNPTARAGVASTQGLADAETTESRLKTALAAQPDSPPLLFALGNLYARQARWSEAQQAYFQAYAADPENPDFIFNVAVSLDHLRKIQLAAQYYRMALAAGETRAAGFDRDQARNRLAELQP